MGHTCTNAWAAGVIDADGCITIKRRYSRSRYGRSLNNQRYYSLFVIVAQSGPALPPMLKKLHEHYGGNFEKPYQAKRKNSQLRWTWYLAHGQAEKFLRRISRHLVQKKNQAEIALEFREKAIGPPGKKRATASATQENYYLRLRASKNYTKTNSDFWETTDD